MSREFNAVKIVFWGEIHHEWEFEREERRALFGTRTSNRRVKDNAPYYPARELRDATISARPRCISLFSLFAAFYVLDGWRSGRWSGGAARTARAEAPRYLQARDWHPSRGGRGLLRLFSLGGTWMCVDVSRSGERVSQTAAFCCPAERSHFRGRRNGRSGICRAGPYGGFHLNPE